MVVVNSFRIARAYSGCLNITRKYMIPRVSGCTLLKVTKLVTALECNMER